MSDEIVVGSRVTMADTGPGSRIGAGTVLRLIPLSQLSTGGALVAWDVQTEEVPARVFLDDLRLDADLPDAKTALTKALHYKAQRDRALAQLWARDDRDAELEMELGRLRSRLAAELVRNDAAKERLEVAERLLDEVAVEASGILRGLSDQLAGRIERFNLAS